MNLNKINPDWAFALNHAKANKIGQQTPTQQSNQNDRVCPCCHCSINKQQIPLCENTKQLEFLGFGVPLYFSFLRMCIVLLSIAALSYNVISIYWAITHNYEFCLEAPQKSSRLLAGESYAEPKCWTFMVRLARIQNSVPIEEQIVRIISWVLQLAFLIYMRHEILKKAEYFDERSTTPSDYSIMIKQLQPQKQLKAKLSKFLQELFPNPYPIQEYTFLPDQPTLRSLNSQQENVIKQIKQFYKDNVISQDEQQLKKLERQLERINNQKFQEALGQKQLEERDELESEKVIICVESEEIKHYIIQTFNQIKYEKMGDLVELFGVQADRITLGQAPEPGEIIWENINQKKSKRILRSIISWMICLLMLVILTVVCYFVLHAKTSLIIDSLAKGQQQDKNSELSAAIAIVYITILLILLFNKLVMAYVFHKLTDFQLLETGFKFQRSFGIKYCLGLFFTTALMTLIVEGIQSKNFYTYIYGLIDEEVLMFFSAVTFIPVFWLINPFYQFQRFQRYMKYGKKDLTQGEANLIMEEKQYDIGKRYAEIIEIVWFTLLYQTLIPLGAFLSIIGLILYYWIDKYNLLRRSVLKVNLSSKLSFTFLAMVQWSLVFESAGSLLFDGLLRQFNQLNLVSGIVMTALGIIYIFIPKNDMIDYLFAQKFKLESRPFSEGKKMFVKTYHNSHPIIKLLNKQKYQSRLNHRLNQQGFGEYKEQFSLSQLREKEGLEESQYYYEIRI